MIFLALHDPCGKMSFRWKWAQEVHTVLFSIRTERALEALGRLAAIATPGQRVYLEDILDGTDAPRAFLSKVFTRLSRAGIVTSLRGRFGGYTLARDPDRITLREVVEAVDGADPQVRLPLSQRQFDPGGQSTRWAMRMQPVQAAIQQMLETTTLADLREECAGRIPRVKSGDVDGETDCADASREESPRLQIQAR